MSGIDAVSSPTDPGATSADDEVQQAMSNGVVEFMGVMLQSMQGDITQAINDTTSDPDAPS